MRLVVFALMALSGPFSVLAENPVDTCKSAPEFPAVFPDHQTSPDTPAKYLSGTPIFIRSQRPDSTVCVALSVDETGVPEDVFVLSPPTLSLSKRERNTLLAHRFSPALVDGKPVKSIEIIRVVKSQRYIKR